MKLKYTPHFIKALAIIACLIFISQIDLSAQTFTGYYGDTQANAIKQTSDGGYIVAGFTDLSTAGGYDIYLMKTDTNGNVLWKKTYGGTGDDEATSLQITTDGGFIITGFTNSFGAGGYDMYLIKTNNVGDTLWSRTYGGISDEQATSVQQTSDGGYILSGYTYSYGAGGGYADAYLVKTNANGDTLWTKVYGGAAGDEKLNAVVQCVDKGYIAVGYSKSFPSASNPRFFALKTDSNGVIAGGIAPTFARYFGSSADDEATSVVQATDGGFVIGGFTEASTGSGTYTRGEDYDMALVKLTDTGTPTIPFQYHYGGQVVLDGSYDDMCYSVQKTADGGYIMGGSSQVNLSGIFWEMFLVKTDANGIGGGNGNLIYPDNGTTSWSETYGIYGGGDDQGYSALQTSDGGYIIAGENSGGTIFICKTDTVGNDCDQSDFPLYEQGPLSWTLSTPLAAVFKVNSGGIVKSPLTIVGNGPAIDTTFDCRSNAVVLPPTANYTASDSAFCIGNCISFTNTSVNATSYQWLFPGGTPSSSAAATPSNICYNASGNFDVTLIASNATGSDTLLISNYINVYNKPTIPVNPPAAAVCKGQSEQLTASGGNTYSWSPSTGLSSTSGDTVNANPSSTITYTVTGTDVNGCSNTASVTLTINPLPVINAGNDVTICGDSAQLNVTGAPGGSTYSWSPTTGLSNPDIANPHAAPLINTAYIVTATDPLGCSGTDTVNVNIGTITAVAIPDTTICEGDAVQLLASGGTNYQWMPSTGLSDSTIANPFATALDTTTYTVTVSSGTCSGTATVTIDVLPSPPTPAIILVSDTLYCTFDPSYTSYQWYNDTTPINLATLPYLVISENGNYNLQVSNANGCKIAVGINVAVLGISPLSSGEAMGVRLYPNPSNGVFEIVFSSGKSSLATVEMQNVLGEIVYSKEFKTTEGLNKVEVAGQSISQGVYFLKITANNNVITQKVVIEK